MKGYLLGHTLVGDVLHFIKTQGAKPDDAGRLITMLVGQAIHPNMLIRALSEVGAPAPIAELAGWIPTAAKRSLVEAAMLYKYHG